MCGARRPDLRIWCWAAAALIDLFGTWTAHPAPGRTTRTERLPFDAEHVLGRMLLFLIILLGETVLTLGRAVSAHHSDPLTPLMALVGLLTIYFGRAEQLAASHAAATEGPIRSVHLGINVIYGVVAAS
ncbi:low temperature requirement protein A [Saccharopolyspora sp. NPDC050642]|uniref:low temperature requirement protein A n=1 Tax=Saccharopolyspora sp. NPDC050642 TaxID=3157099 RepID=UPI0033F96DD4